VVDVMTKLAIVIPCYNEEEVLGETVSRLEVIYNDLVEKKIISNESFISLVNDGSRDKTWELIEKFASEKSFIEGIKLSRNCGHQNALLAGLMQNMKRADCIISMDADLQDDIEAIYQFLDKFNEGYEVVYGVRNDRTTDSKFKKLTAEGFYKFQSIMGVEAVSNHADYRLLSSRAVEKLADFREVNLFLRGIVPLLGFKSTSIFYKRAERFAGESKYPFKKMLSFALDGITSFSTLPLRMITLAGFVIFLISVFMSLWIVFEKIFLGEVVRGWASTIITIYFIGGIQMISTGLIGEYIGKIYKEVKARPRFIIETETYKEK
jgi:glycosyltransferase involved in cell wall biosynthesis